MLWSNVNAVAESGALSMLGVSGLVFSAQDVGYAEPISAHQLLYPGGEDTRALLLELLSMLPAEGVRCPLFSTH